jgi:hypothetical protein
VIHTGPQKMLDGSRRHHPGGAHHPQTATSIPLSNDSDTVRQIAGNTERGQTKNLPPQDL